MKIVVLTNILTPYRMDFFNKMYEEIDLKGGEFKVLVMAKTEEGREWDYDDLKKPYTKLLKCSTLSYNGVHMHFNSDFKKVIKDINPSIVICAGSYISPTVWKAIKIREKLKFKVLFWSESHLHEERSYSTTTIFVRDKIRSYIYKKFDGFLCAGELSKLFVTLYMNASAKLFFLPNTIDNNTYYNSYLKYKGQKNKLREEFGISENKYVFITPARLVHVKGIDKFLELCKYSLKKDKATFLVAGSGELSDKLQYLANKNNVDLRLLGYRGQDEITKLYAMSDCFLLPSISDANPLTVIEALWSALPIFVSSNVGNYPETVVNGKNGYVFDHSEPEETAKTLDKLITNDEDWNQEASKLSLKIAHNTYDSDRIVKEFVQELEDEYL